MSNLLKRLSFVLMCLLIFLDPPLDSAVHRSMTLEVEQTGVFSRISLYPSETALILIDTWSYHPDEQILHDSEVNAQSKLQRLLVYARAAGLKVIHAPHGYPVFPFARPISGEVVVTDHYSSDDVFRDLYNGGIRVLLYAGYASNLCIINRPIGIVNAHRSGKFVIIFVKDASKAISESDQVVARFIEKNFAPTTTVRHFEEAVRRYRYSQ